MSRETGSAGAILIPIENRVPGLVSSPNMQDVLGGYFDGGWNTCETCGSATNGDHQTGRARVP